MNENIFKDARVLATDLLNTEGAKVTTRGLYYDGYSQTLNDQREVWNEALDALLTEAKDEGLWLKVRYIHDDDGELVACKAEYVTTKAEAEGEEDDFLIFD